MTITGAGDSTISATAAGSSQQSSYSLVVTKASQSIALSGTQTVDAVVGQSIAAPVSGSVGPGQLSYTSMSPTVASVDASTGVVTVLATGTATISITKAGNANYNSASASFSVAAIANTVVLNSWIGASDSLVTAAPEVPGVGFYRSTSSDCVLTSYESCPNGQHDVFGTSAITDTAVNASRPGYYWLQMARGPGGVLHSQDCRRPHVFCSLLSRHGCTQRPALPRRRIRCRWHDWPTAQRCLVFGRRQGMDSSYTDRCIPCSAILQLDYLQRQLWSKAGHDGTSLLNDVWVSSDGITWTQKPLSPGFTPRSNAGLAVFQNKLWLIGGADASGPRNDVWSTIDGVTWTQGTSSAAFSPRYGTALQQLGTKLFIVGGARLRFKQRRLVLCGRRVLDPSYLRRPVLRNISASTCRAWKSVIRLRWHRSRNRLPSRCVELKRRSDLEAGDCNGFMAASHLFDRHRVQ